jgi:site-specific DNA-methyltransferase (adenine-specific)
VIVHVLRKPLVGTVAANALQHGCGALNIDQCRVSLSSDEDPDKLSARSGGLPDRLNRSRFTYGAVRDLPAGWDCSKGRWPANLVHDGSDEVIAIFPEAGNGWKKNYGAEVYAIENRQYGGGSFGGGGFLGGSTYSDSGSASRFFQQVTIE